MSNLALIPAQEANFRTSQITDWLDGLPLIAAPGPGGVIASAANIGVGSLVVAAVDAGADLAGVQVVKVTGIASGITYLTVTDADGTVTASGVVGLPIYANGVTFTLAQVAGQAALAIGDTFAIATLPLPVDLTGLVFTLGARIAAGAATYALQATSAPADGSTATIVNGGAAGTVAMQVPRSLMARCQPGTFPHNIIATDPVTGQSVTAFYGLITHAALLQPQS
ncbi:hypothetical protein [Methylobacterium sp. 1973]|uniref:hypothetical protein n=1 Tax=Methylobacterium sp. 1973 TaxID=3156421 RepID=UPI0033925DD9